MAPPTGAVVVVALVAVLVGALVAVVGALLVAPRVGVGCTTEGIVPSGLLLSRATPPPMRPRTTTAATTMIRIFDELPALGAGAP
jgi:hypothetical protein